VGVLVGGTGVLVGVSVATAVGEAVGAGTVGVLVGTTSGVGCGPCRAPHPVNKKTITMAESRFLFI